ncbi:MAG: L-2-hydroxyglutarate oxidase [Bacteroidales bacterium]|nr:L-2-hydroxyglutarate oxidase [Bacteroidales bacterium]MCF8390993.1 L-2-hydroxyglutarate oxidase [Bacteroidales bacterium]
MTSDIIIIGGGIVGLSTAYKIKEKYPSLKVILLEKESEVSMHQTGNNSGVIHSGIYYRPGSLKALNCLRGYDLLLDFAKKNDIKYELCGKVIVATKENELGRLEDLYQKGIQNGLTNLKRLSKEEVLEKEPNVTAIKGVDVPYTGIIDYKEVSRKIKDLFIHKMGGEVFLNEEVTDIKMQSGLSTVITKNKTYSAKLIINTAGLFSDRIATLTFGKHDYRIIPFRGEYYTLSEEKKSLVNNLIYPVPDPEFPFLGVHFTRMINGKVEAGPNAVFSFKREGYKKTSFSFKDSWASFSWPGLQKLMLVHMSMGIGEFYRSYNKAAFTRSLQKLIPDISSRDLVPGGAGVRAQACDRKGKLIDDFLFLENENVINVLNAPSPAATASFSIGETIAEKAIVHFS